MDSTADLAWATRELRRAGCLAPEEEAELLARHADGDGRRLAVLVERRREGEPLAWILGWAEFCGQRISVRSGVYVPRPQTEPLVLAAVERLPERGCAVDLCTGSGAIPAVLKFHRPCAEVVATELDPTAAACARENQVTVFDGDMTSGLPARLLGGVDVVTAVVPYVPTDEMRFLPSDVTTYEPLQALDGGPDGMRLLRQAAREAAPFLRVGGWLLVEVGGNQGARLRQQLPGCGYEDIVVVADEDHEARAVYCRRAAVRPVPRP